MHLGLFSDLPLHFIFLALHRSQACEILVLPLDGFLMIFQKEDEFGFAEEAEAEEETAVEPEDAAEEDDEEDDADEADVDKFVSSVSASA